LAPECLVSRRIDLQTAAADPGPIDDDQIAPLRDLGADDFHELVQLFLDEGASRVARLRSLLDQGDAPALAGVAHTLRGTSAAFGAAGLAALCAAIEAAATGGSGTDLPRLVGDVALEFDRVRARLNAELR
jgi:HPt (histidine-containing phosphotransfer) domain-containing protein